MANLGVYVDWVTERASGLLKTFAAYP